MTQPAPITTSQIKQVERRVEKLETIIRRLANGVEIKNKTPKEQISPAAERRYLKELVKFLEEEKVKPKPGFTSAKELVNYLEQYETGQNH